MISKKNIERQENSSVKLSITVSKEDAKKEYDKLLKKYAAAVQIKGFRKGKVPVSLLERKFGEGIISEASANIVDEAIKEAFEVVEEKPLPYAMPELVDQNIDMTLGEDFSFAVTYDVFPEITLGEYKNLPVKETQVSVTKVDDEREIKTLQEQNSIVVDKKDGKVAKDSIVTINYCELDSEDKPVEGTNREDFVFTVGTGYNIYKIDDDIVGMKLDQEKVITKKYPEDFESAELAGLEKKLQVKVTAVKEKELPAIDDELAKDISDKYETLDDLKKDTRAKLKENAAQGVKAEKLQQIFDQILEKSSLELPASMLKAELENAWYKFVQQSRMPEETLITFLQAENKTKENVMEEWKPDVAKNLKIKLLVSKIVTEEKIEASEQDIEKEMAEQAKLGGMSIEDTKKYFDDNKLIDYLKEQVVDTKVRDFLLASAEITKGDKVKYLDFINKQQ